MSDVLATMVTMTTYATWLRGDERGWIDDGILMPANPILEQADLERCKHPPYFFDREDCLSIGREIGKSLIERLDLCLFALTVRTWHVHFVYVATSHEIPEIVKCAKDAARYALRPGRPIWTEKYDKRWCFNDRQVLARINYVERHNLEWGLPAKPYEFIQGYREYN